MNSRMQNLMKVAFPISDNKPGRLFIKIKQKNSEKLRDAIESFVSAFMMMLEELDMFRYSEREVIENTRVQVGDAGSSCIVLIPLDSTEVHQQLLETIETSLAFLNDTGFRVSGGIGLGLTLKDLVQHVKVVNQGQQEDCSGTRPGQEDQQRK